MSFEVTKVNSSQTITTANGQGPSKSNANPITSIMINHIYYLELFFAKMESRPKIAKSDDVSKTFSDYKSFITKNADKVCEEWRWFEKDLRLGQPGKSEEDVLLFERTQANRMATRHYTMEALIDAGLTATTERCPVSTVSALSLEYLKKLFSGMSEEERAKTLSSHLHGILLSKINAVFDLLRTSQQQAKIKIQEILPLVTWCFDQGVKPSKIEFQNLLSLVKIALSDSKEFAALLQFLEQKQKESAAA